MKVVTVSKTGSGSTSAVVLNTDISPFNVGFGVIVSGVVNYTVQHTFDDPASTLSTWFPHPTLASQIASADGNYAFPVTAIRVTVNSGAGSVTLKAIQAGI